MKRMVDNKKLREIEASVGTRWYEHEINFTGTYGSASTATLLSLRKDTLKNGEWAVGNDPIFLKNFGDPSGLNVSTSFPTLYVQSDMFMIYYINNNNEIANFTINKSAITSEKVTAL